MHRALGVDPAAIGAGAALNAGAGVAGDRAAGGAQRFGARHRELAVAPHALGVERRHPQEALGLGEVGVEVTRPAHPVLVAPVGEDLVGRAEAGPRVDHRRPADHLRDRDRNRRVALGHGQAGVAVEGRDRVEVALGIAVAVEVATRLEHDHVEPGLGELGRRRGAAGARADDHDVAFLAVALRACISQRAGRLGNPAVSQSAAGLDPDPPLDLGQRRVAQGREDLRHQQKLVVESEARPLHAPQEVVTGLGVEAAEAPRERQPLEGAQSQPNPGQHPRRERLEELGDRAGHVDLALGGGQPVDAGPHRCADRAKGPLLGGREPRRALSAGAGPAVDATAQRPEPERDEHEAAVDEEVEQVGEYVFVEEVEAERGQ